MLAGHSPIVYRWGQFHDGSVTAHPVPRSTCGPESAVFSVAASGSGPFIYTRRKGTATIEKNVNPSAASATLTIPDVRAADPWSYRCINFGACSAAASNPATFKVCAGDFNCDTVIEDLDFSIFVFACEILL